MRTNRFFLFFSLSTALAQSPAVPTVIRTETRQVLVDAVVTDKAGSAVRGLTAKDFHVFEDGKEQAIQTATFVADAAGPDVQRTYLVLFFDNATLDFASQGRARDAAAQFIDANAGPNRFMAIVNYGGAISIAQNFTTDVDRLKRVVADVQGGSQIEVTNVDPTAPTMGNATLGRALATAGFGSEGFILGLRRLALNLASVPGRKSVMVFSAGFPMTTQLNVQINSAVQACNRADIALYPVDVSGLGQANSQISLDAEVASAGGLNPTKGSNTGKNAQLHPTDTPTSTVASTQQVLYTLAAATGGYVYANANNLSVGLAKIGKEQTDYYLLGYSPSESPDGSCHPLKVKVDKGGVSVRARTTYCNVKALDLLAGKPLEQELESRLTGNDAGKIAASMLVPYFYPEADSARLNVAMEIPANSIQFEKKGKPHAEVNILGIAYRPDGTVGARFSDTVKLDFATTKELDAFRSHPLHYEKQFQVSPGAYSLKVIFSSGGDSFGRVQAPLTIDPYDGKTFMLSGLALSKEAHPASDMGTPQDTELLEGRTPLVFKDARITPSGAATFAKTDSVLVYGEIYEPLLTSTPPPLVEIRMQVVDVKTKAPKSVGAMQPTIPPNPTSTTLPFALKLKVDTLPPGAYRVDVEAVDSAGKTMLHSADFEIK